MSINTEDRDALRRVPETKIMKDPDQHQWFWYCPRCAFRGTWTTERGAVTKIAEHLMAKHHVQLRLPSRSES